VQPQRRFCHEHSQSPEVPPSWPLISASAPSARCIARAGSNTGPRHVRQRSARTNAWCNANTPAWGTSTGSAAYRLLPGDGTVSEPREDGARYPGGGRSAEGHGDGDGNGRPGVAARSGFEQVDYRCRQAYTAGCQFAAGRAEFRQADGAASAADGASSGCRWGDAETAGSAASGWGTAPWRCGSIGNRKCPAQPQ
jgi:hypothetical protein